MLVVTLAGRKRNWAHTPIGIQLMYLHLQNLVPVVDCICICNIFFSELFTHAVRFDWWRFSMEYVDIQTMRQASVMCLLL